MQPIGVCFTIVGVLKVIRKEDVFMNSQLFTGTLYLSF